MVARIQLRVFDKDAVKSYYDDSARILGRAAKAAARQVGGETLKAGRADIRSSGKFTGAWVTGLQMKEYPKRRQSLNARAYINHRFGGLASVFGFGSTIRPKRKTLLWIRLPGAPKTVKTSASFGRGRVSGGKIRATPARVGEKAGGLEYVKTKRMKYPRLGIYVGRGKNKRFKALYMGIPQAVIRPRWNLFKIAAENQNKLSSVFSAQVQKLKNNGR